MMGRPTFQIGPISVALTKMLGLHLVGVSHG